MTVPWSSLLAPLSPELELQVVEYVKDLVLVMFLFILYILSSEDFSVMGLNILNS